MSTFSDKLRQYGVAKTLQFVFWEAVHLIYHQPILGSYSLSQEDLFLDKLLGYKKKGCYVDVGAFDPYRFSNTMRFYRRGWRGINIEPDVERWKKFRLVRRRDINLNVGAGERSGSVDFFVMDPPTISTFSQKQAAVHEKHGFRITSKKKVRVLPLRQILTRHLGKKNIDFLSMDVEGYEMNALRGNDWKRFRPRFLCIETAIVEKEQINRFLHGVGYTMVFDNGGNSFYRDVHEK